MYTYIVIDDEGLMRKGTIKKLETLKEQIACAGEAEDGARALELIEETDPDIIITDMNMPVMDGTQLLPILTERFPGKRIIVISGYKDFEYMKQALTAKAVDYLLKPFSRQDLQEAVLRALSQLEKGAALENQLISSEESRESARYEYDIQMLKNVVLGYHTDSCTITSEKLNFISRTHDLILMTLHCPSPINEKDIQDFLGENGFGDLALYLQHIHHKTLGFLVLFIPEHAALLPNDLCRQIVRSLGHLFFDLSLDVSYGISDVHHSLSELHEAFIETVSALNLSHPGDTVNSYYYSGSPQEAQSIVWDRMDEFLFRVEAGMSEQVEELLDGLFLYFREGTSYTLYDIKVYCFRLADQARHIMSQYIEQINPDSANSSMQNILNSLFDLEELKQYYLQFFQNIAGILKLQSVYAGNDTVEKMKVYIERHYQNNLTIEFLSSLFYMNRSYLSHLFKEKTGDTYVNYLNRIRIEKAKQLLLDSSKKMYQIARSVGYDNVKYFFRVFKKYEHMTPEQYRSRSGI